MTHYQRLGHPNERQLALSLVPSDIDRGKSERKRLNAIKTEGEIEVERIEKAQRKATKLRIRMAAGKA